MFFKEDKNLSYIDSLKNIAVNLLKMLKTGETQTDDAIDKYIELIKKIKDEDNMNSLRENIVKFTIQYDNFIMKKNKETNFIVKSIINALAQIAKDYDVTKQWQNSFANIKELLRQDLTYSTLSDINTILKNLIFSTKDTKELVYRELSEIIFLTLDIVVDESIAKSYKEELFNLKKEIHQNPILLNTYPTRATIKKLIEKKEKLEEEYYELVQQKLNKAIKTLTYVMNTFSKDINGYDNLFQEHINQIDNLVNVENVDVDEMSKRLIGIALKIKESTINMKSKIKTLSESIERSQKSIIELQNKLKEAQENLIVDPLTKIYNRRGLWHFLQYEIERSKRYNSTFSIIMGDLDKFSEINNTYGHIVGDKVLEAFAKTAKSLARSSDIITRYGGEEFLIIVPDQIIENAYVFAEKIRKAVESLKFKYKDKDFTITISFGVSQCRQDDTIETLIERADKTLYEAKKTRNTTKKELS